MEERLAKIIKSDNHLLRIFLAEFLGTFLLCFVGIGSICQSWLLETTLNEITPRLNICLSFGIAVAGGIYIGVNVSGGHINPAVTIANAILGRLGRDTKENAKMFFLYSIAQITGAFCASAMVYFIYSNPSSVIEQDFSEGFNLTKSFQENLISLFATGPNPSAKSCLISLVDQIMGTWILIVVIFAVTDDRNGSAGNLAPLIIGFCACIIGLSYGSMSGGAINPARDLGPRMFVSLVQSFDIGFQDMFWLIPTVGPLIGGIFGVFTYLTFISAHHDTLSLPLKLINDDE